MSDHMEQPDKDLPKPSGAFRRPASLQRYTILFFGIALLLAVVALGYQQRAKRIILYYTDLLEQQERNLDTHLSLTGQLQRQIDALTNQLQQRDDSLRALQRQVDEGSALETAVDALMQADGLLREGRLEEVDGLLADLDRSVLSNPALVFLEQLELRLNLARETSDGG